MKVCYAHTPSSICLFTLQPPSFEDPTGQISLPPAVHGRIASWKRPAEVTAGQVPPPWVVVSPKRFETFPQFHIQSESEKAFLRAKKLRVKPKMLVSALSAVQHHPNTWHRRRTMG